MALLKVCNELAYYRSRVKQLMILIQFMPLWDYVFSQRVNNVVHFRVDKPFNRNTIIPEVGDFSKNDHFNREKKMVE